ncbi:MAG: helix-turn-helix domain-containing protein [Bdellovibrionales bacterium]|nr:helix-turn-helix domain-containing protein [Bdellovibrionales bacterium]
MKRMTTNVPRPTTLESSLKTQGWMCTDQVAAYLGTSPNNVRNMVYKGQLTPRKFGGRWRYKRDEIDHLIETEGA